MSQKSHKRMWRLTIVSFSSEACGTWRSTDGWVSISAPSQNIWPCLDDPTVYNERPNILAKAENTTSYLKR